MFAHFPPDAWVSGEHPLRSIKAYAETGLRRIDAELDALYGATCRPSIPSERLLKDQLLIALYSIRADRSFGEQLDYNLLCRWFLEMSLAEPGPDQSNFSQPRSRLDSSSAA